MKRQPNHAFYQISGNYGKYTEKLCDFNFFCIKGESISLEQLSSKNPLKKNHTDKKLLDNLASTFLHELSSQKSDLSIYLNSILSTKKRKDLKNDNHPAKVIKLSRGAKRRIQTKKLKEGLKLQQKNQKAKRKIKEKVEEIGIFYTKATKDNISKSPLSLLQSS